MQRSTKLIGVFFMAILFLSSCLDKQNTPDQNSPDHSNSSETTKAQIETELREANESFYTALNAMFIGEMELMDAIWSHGTDVTQMGPFGGRLTGWENVRGEFQRNADMKLGGKVLCKDLKVYAGSDMGFTVCLEEGENIDENGDPVKVYFRATNIFHNISDEWKLVHHHTDLSSELQGAFGSNEQ